MDATQSHRAEARSAASAAPDSLAIELARLDRLFAIHLTTLRTRGRSALGDAVGGAVIEEGEAEGLLASLFETHNSPSAVPMENWVSPLAGLEHARYVFQLSPLERDALLLAASVELDSRYSRLVAFLNDHVALTRPTLGLAMAMLAPDHDSERLALLRACIDDGPVQRFGLLELCGDGPITSRAIRVPASFWPRLVGLSAPARFALASPRLNRDDLVLDDGLAAQTNAAAAWLRRQDNGRALVVVSGEAGSGRDTVARLLASEMHWRTITVEAETDDPQACLAEILRESQWHQACVVLRDAHLAPDAFHRELQRQLATPLICITEPPHDGNLLDRSQRPCAEITVPPVTARTLSRLWENLSGQRALNVDATSLANRFGFGPARIDNALRIATSIADSSGRAQAQCEVERVCRKLQRVQFDGLAHKLPCPFDESDIVLPEKTRHELDLICTWAQHGQRIFGEQGLGRSLHTGRGLICLFSGPPGTGKTMGAQVVARRIGFDVYRIDLSQVVNKYIGETEKNLARVFDEAQRSKVILFFDEAETLYGDRSEVKTAQDRFANIEIGYLLQRIETFEGVAILATNLQKNLDEAFLRRLNVTAEFPIPGPEERRLIWQKLLPSVSERSDDVDVDLLSRQFKIAGGDIRNAIFSALLLAADAQEPLAMVHLVRGLWRELQKSGRVVDTAQFGRWRSLVGAEPVL